MDITSDNLLDVWEYLTDKEREKILSAIKDTALPKPKVELFNNRASAVDWITSHFFVPELKGPIWLAPYQVEAMNTALYVSPDGLFNYDLIIWSDIKKSIKSTCAAAIALWMAFRNEYASVKVIGNKRDQAKSRSYYYITRSLQLNPTTKKMLDDGDIVINKYNIKLNFNHSEITAIPVSPGSEAGGNDDCVLFTEAWAARTDAARELWTETVIPPAKFRRGFRLCESYAGNIGQNSILEPLYNTYVKDAYRVHKDYEFYVHGTTFCMWNTQGRMPWHTQAYFDSQRAQLTDSEFRRIHQNQWVASSEKFVPEVWWDALREHLPTLTEKEKMIIGVDAAIKDDCFALVGITKHPTESNKLAVRLVKVWYPHNGKIMLENPYKDKPEKDIEYPYGFIVDLAKRYKVVMATYDPYQLSNFAQRMNAARVCYWKEFPQGQQRLKADKMLYDMIVNRELAHNGDNILSEHINNADAEGGKDDATIRLVKRSQSMKIDAAVALSMACYEAKQLRL